IDGPDHTPPENSVEALFGCSLGFCSGRRQGPPQDAATDILECHNGGYYRIRQDRQGGGPAGDEAVMPVHTLVRTVLVHRFPCVERARRKGAGPAPRYVLRRLKPAERFFTANVLGVFLAVVR